MGKENSFISPNLWISVVKYLIFSLKLKNVKYDVCMETTFIKFDLKA